MIKIHNPSRMFIEEVDGTPSGKFRKLIVTNATLTDNNDGSASLNTGGSAGASTAIDYLVGTAQAGLSNEIAVGTTPSGDLSNTWASPTVVDLTITNEAQGDILYFDSANWVRLAAGTNGHFLKTQGAAANPVWAAAAGGAGTWYKHLAIQSAKLTGADITTSMAIDAGERGWRGLMDDTNDEECLYQFVVDPNYAGGTVTAEILFSMTSTQTGVSNIAIEGRFMAVTPSNGAAGDMVDWNTSRYAPTQTSTHALTAGLIAGYVEKSTISFSNANTSSMAIDDVVRIHLRRKTGIANNATGDLELLGVVLHE